MLAGTRRRGLKLRLSRSSRFRELTSHASARQYTLEQMRPGAVLCLPKFIHLRLKLWFAHGSASYRKHFPPAPSRGPAGGGHGRFPRRRERATLPGLAKLASGRNRPTTLSTPRREGSRSAAEWLEPFERSFGSSVWPGLVVFFGGAGAAQGRGPEPDLTTRSHTTRSHTSTQKQFGVYLRTDW